MTSAWNASAAEFVLRGYVPSDLEAMFRLDEICFEEPFRFSRKDMRRFAEARRAQVLIAELVTDQTSELAGFGIVHAERFESELAGYLLTLDVSPNLRRRGLARRLLARAEQAAHNGGCTCMLLHVFLQNHDAISLYEKLGYVRLHLAEDFYGPGLHGWVYRKPLPAAAP